MSEPNNPTERVRWAVFRDHPRTRDIAYIRPERSGPYDRDIATLYNDMTQFAPLLAAAPDLLAALKKLVEWQDEVKNAVPRIYLDNAQRAIAKAEGRSNV